MITIDPIYYNCKICGQRFRYGPKIYDGQHINKYNLTVCKNCFQSAKDGWQKSDEKRLLDHLKKEKISTPSRNSNGLFPRGL